MTSSPDRRWIAGAAFLVFPIAAILHHAVFYYSTCMLNPFGPSWRDGETVAKWLTRDPSLPWAVVLAVLVYRLGLQSPRVREAVVPFLICFFPITLWVWDIPGTDRIICYYFHDGRLILWGVPIMGRHLYGLGAISFAAVIALKLLRARSRNIVQPIAS